MSHPDHKVILLMFFAYLPHGQVSKDHRGMLQVFPLPSTSFKDKKKIGCGCTQHHNSSAQEGHGLQLPAPAAGGGGNPYLQKVSLATRLDRAPLEPFEFEFEWRCLRWPHECMLEGTIHNPHSTLKPLFVT
jgi:hypothetical protein